jgi:hypothetical protein
MDAHALTEKFRETLEQLTDAVADGPGEAPDEIYDALERAGDSLDEVLDYVLVRDTVAERNVQEMQLADAKNRPDVVHP